MKKEIYIVGGGPGNPGELTQRAVDCITGSDEVYAFDRLGEIYQALRLDIIKCNVGDVVARVGNSPAMKIAILVSGDVGFFSMAKVLQQKLSPDYKIELINGISSLPYLCAKLKINYEDIKVVSLHGREAHLPGSISYHHHTFVLTGGEHKAGKVLRNLVRQGLGQIKVTAGELLGMSQERIITGRVDVLVQEEYHDLTVLLFVNDGYQAKEQVLKDGDFLRNKTPMTKQEVRWVSVNMLDISPGDIIFDIGAGSGSVSIEMARRAYEGLVYAIEKDSQALAILAENKKALGALNVLVAAGEATEEMPKLPMPQKAFIGGSSGQLTPIIRYLVEVNPEINLVVNVITLETLTQVLAVFQEIGWQPEIVCLNSAYNQKVGGYNLMRGQNPIYIIRGGADAKEKY